MKSSTQKKSEKGIYLGSTIEEDKIKTKLEHILFS